MSYLKILKKNYGLEIEEVLGMEKSTRVVGISFFKFQVIFIQEAQIQL